MSEQPAPRYPQRAYAFECYRLAADMSKTPEGEGAAFFLRILAGEALHMAYAQRGLYQWEEG